MYINEEIKIFIKLMINTEQWVFGQKIPTEHELASHFFCSRLTIRNAYRSLVDLGYLKSVHGQGYFVSKNLETKALTKHSTVQTNTKIMMGAKPLPKTENKYFDEINISKIKSTENFANYRKIYFINELGSNIEKHSDKGAYQVIDGYVIPSVAKKLDKHLMNESIAFSYWKIREIMNYRKRIVTVRKLTQEEQEKFNIFSDELFAITRSALFNSDNNLIEYSITYTRHDKARIYCDQELS